MTLTRRAIHLIDQEGVMTQNSLSSLRVTRPQPSPQQLVTRHNAVMFYGIAAASILEDAVSLRASLLAAVLGEDTEFRTWIEGVWMPAKRAHAQRARVYVESMWPEFDWKAACDQFAADYRRVSQAASAESGIARVALACSMAAAQAAIFYRGLGAVADDPDLRTLLQEMAADEAVHFERFRGYYERHRQGERLGLLASYRTIVSCASRARNIDVRLAFSRLNGDHWYRSMPFQELDYGEFIARMSSLVRRHLPLTPAQRLLFRPWLNARDVCTATTGWPVSAARPGETSRLAACA
jgi:hypothetical protein